MIDYRHRYYVVGNKDIIIEPKYYDYRLPSLEDSFLDLIDERFGPGSNVPKQTELNDLWAEYQRKTT